MTIQDDLKWNSHITDLNNKLTKSCYAIYILKSNSNLDTLRTVYFANVHSHLKYGIIFWGNSPESIHTFIIQKRILRTMTNTHKYESCKPLFKKLQILPLPCMYILEILIFTKKALLENKDSVTLNAEVHNYDTRQKRNLHVPHRETSLFQKSTLIEGITLYNKLPSEFKSLNSVHTFKNKLKAFLLNHTFYSTKEYIHHKHVSTQI